MTFFLEFPEKIIKYFENDNTINTSNSHPQVVEFIDPSLISQKNLGMCLIPGRFKKNHQRNLDQDLKRMKEHYKVDTIITLVQNHELESMNIKNYFEKVKEYEFSFYHFPIKDKWLPESTGLFKCVDFIIQALKDGKKVAVHCNGGKGRCATVCACVLIIMERYSYEKSIEIIKSTRKGTLKNPFQKYYLSNFEENYNKWKNEKNQQIKM